MPKYIFLQYIDESAAPRPGTPELDAVIQAFATYLEELKEAAAFIEGDPCQPSSAAFTVQVRDGEASTTDGPMSSAVPWLNGYFVLNCSDRAAAAAWAAKNPAAHVGSVEVHPILTL
jgi:hypothetical protein